MNEREPDLPGAAADLAATARIALACLDLTSLNDGDDAAAIDVLCARAAGPRGVVAAVCVWPRFVARARTALTGPIAAAMGAKSVRIAAVANFPDGSGDVGRAVGDAQAIVDSGGDEVDLVLPWRTLAAGNVRAAAALVAAVRRVLPATTLKLIVESGELPDAAALREACAIGLGEGVDFLKTSTGKTPVSATPEAARTMLEAIARHPRGREVGFKASGGIRRVADAAVYVALAREHLGAEALQPRRLRFGASALLADIEATLLGASPAAPPPAGGY